MITNCTLDSDIFTNTRYSKSITVVSIKEYSFTVELSHIFAGKCESLIDPKRTYHCHLMTPYCKYHMKICKHFIEENEVFVQSCSIQ